MIVCRLCYIVILNHDFLHAHYNDAITDIAIFAEHTMFESWILPPYPMQAKMSGIVIITCGAWRGYPRCEQSLHRNASIFDSQCCDIFTDTMWIRKGHGSKGSLGNTDYSQTLTFWVYSMDAITTLTCCLGKWLEMNKHFKYPISCIPQQGNDKRLLAIDGVVQTAVSPVC